MFDGRTCFAMSTEKLRKRWSLAGGGFQDPMTLANPVLTNRYQCARRCRAPRVDMASATNAA